MKNFVLFRKKIPLDISKYLMSVESGVKHHTHLNVSRNIHILGYFKTKI
jgi:hypothetical protein